MYYTPTKRKSQARKTKSELFHDRREVWYPDGTIIVYQASAEIFREPGYVGDDLGTSLVDLDFLDKPVESPADVPADDSESIARSARRARNQIRDICWCTSFKWFVTLTLDPERIDRYDRDLVVKKLSKWLDHNVERRGLAYVIVPELHQDGALHFHGFFNDALDADFKFSGHWQRNGGSPQRVYNLPRWKYGFTTATKIDLEHYHEAVGYIRKYITKQQPDDTKRAGMITGRWYYSGGNLFDKGRPIIRCVKTRYMPIEDVLAEDEHHSEKVAQYKVLDDVDLAIYETFAVDAKTGQIYTNPYLTPPDTN